MSSRAHVRALSSFGVLLAGALCVGAILPLASASAGVSANEYLALGDSLAAGYQPVDGASLPPVSASSGYRDAGYPNGYAQDLAAHEHLRLVDLACPGETSASFSSAPAQSQCARLYRSEFRVSSQLSAALEFLSENKGRVALLTIDLGANDLDKCISTSISPSCLAKASTAVQANVARVLSKLTASAHRNDPQARILAMNYYDPFLALAFSPGGAAGIAQAAGSLAAVDAFNAGLSNAYRAKSVIVVDVSSAFRTNAAMPIARYDNKSLPQDVASVCKLTYMCPVIPSRQRNIHPNQMGYQVIAAAFRRVLANR